MQVSMTVGIGTMLLVTTLVFAAAPAAADSMRQIEAEVIVDAPRSEVWEAWTTTDGVTSFFAPAAQVELRPGGPFEIYFNLEAPAGSRGSEGCTVLSYVPQRVLSFTWNAPPQFLEVRGQRTFVVILLEDAADGGTRVQLTHGGWRAGEQWDEVFEYFSAAWPRVLENLRLRFAEGPRFEAAATLPPPRPRERYVYFLHPTRPDFPAALTPAEQEAMAGHWRHLLGLLAKGRLILAGPCTGSAQYPDATEAALPLVMPTPGIVVFEATSDDEAKAVMEGDPAVAAGVFKACVNPFTLSLLRR